MCNLLLSLGQEQRDPKLQQSAGTLADPAGGDTEPGSEMVGQQTGLNGQGRELLHSSLSSLLIVCQIQRKHCITYSIHSGNLDPPSLSPTCTVVELLVTIAVVKTGGAASVHSSYQIPSPLLDSISQV